VTTFEQARAELDRFLGPRQPDRELIRGALAGASHVFVHAYDGQRVMVKKRGCRVDRPLPPAAQAECRQLIHLEGWAAPKGLVPRSGRNGASLHWLPQPIRLPA